MIAAEQDWQFAGREGASDRVIDGVAPRSDFAEVSITRHRRRNGVQWAAEVACIMDRHALRGQCGGETGDA
jgi:hypothetical protein